LEYFILSLKRINRYGSPQAEMFMNPGAKSLPMLQPDINGGAAMESPGNMAGIQPDICAPQRPGSG